MSDRPSTARALYAAFASADRDFVERILADDFTFSSPPDPLLDRAGYFERCWPGAGSLTTYEFPRIIESGDEVVVTYEATRSGERSGILGAYRPKSRKAPDFCRQERHDPGRLPRDPPSDPSAPTAALHVVAPVRAERVAADVIARQRVGDPRGR